jgi:archaellum component FlaC
MAGRTPFNVDQLANAATMLRQSGIAAKDLIPTLTMLGNVAGGSSEKFSRISMNFAQIQSTMKATSMDIRQFAMAGIPIYKMLDEMGVRGTATADDITAAFKRMTEAGGQFEGAMAKGAQTLQGMRTNLEGLKEQNKALRAEYMGMSDAAKGWAEMLTKAYAASNEQLQKQIELKKILDKKGNGPVTIEDEYKEAELRIALIKSQMEKLNNGRGRDDQEIMIAGLKKQLELYTAILEQLQPMIDAQNLINDSLARYNEEIERSEKGYRDLQAKIEEYYGKTKEGQREAIENEIKYFEAAKQRKRLVDVMGFDMAAGKRIVVGKREAGIEAKELKETDIILKMLYENLANIDKKAKDAKHDFADWVEILASATGYTKENVEALKGLGTVQQYAKEVEAIQETLLSQDGDLLTALGLDKLDVLESSADRVRSVLERMISSGKWDGSDKSVQFLINAVKKLDEVAGSSRFEEYIKSLSDEIVRLDSPKLQAIETAKKALEGAGMKSPKEAEI